MHWANKPQTINPVPSGVEIKLLTRAYNAQPGNQRFFTKLMEALILENKLQSAIDLCVQHLGEYEQDDHVYAMLTYLYRKTNNIDALINTGESALRYSPQLETRLQLAYAYAKKGLYQQAEQQIPAVNSASMMSVNNLRLMFEIYLNIDLAEHVCQIYSALGLSQKADSGLKSNYLKALCQLGRQSEIDKLIDHQKMIKEYHLLEPDKQIDLNDLNQKLASYFLSHSGQNYEPGNHTTRHGSQLYLESDWYSPLRDLEIEIKKSVERYFHEDETAHIKNGQSFYLNFWANILGEKGYQISHIHPEALVSGVYYVSVPKSVKKQDESVDRSRQGYLLFSQPESNSRRYVQPTEGLIVLFPSYFYHETLPLKYDEQRICVAFDVVCGGANKA